MTNLYRCRSAISNALGEVQLAESKARCNGGPAEKLAALRETLKDVAIEIHCLTGGGAAFSQSSSRTPSLEPSRRFSD